MDAKAINKFPIREYLAARGIRPAKDRGYYGLYHSPFREDSTPSMKVDYDKNLYPRPQVKEPQRQNIGRGMKW